MSDGTRLRAGDRMIVLHIWNEQFPQMPAGGPTIGFAARATRCVELSLRELARHLAARPQLADIKAIRADMHPSGRREHERFAYIMARFGFETIASPHPRSPTEWIRRFGENILISIFILARNPTAFRIDSLGRHRDAAYLSRRLLEQRHGGSYP